MTQRNANTAVRYLFLLNSTELFNNFKFTGLMARMFTSH